MYEALTSLLPAGNVHFSNVIIFLTSGLGMVNFRKSKIIEVILRTINFENCKKGEIIFVAF